jgi:hypothetical protein
MNGVLSSTVVVDGASTHWPSAFCAGLDPAVTRVRNEWVSSKVPSISRCVSVRPAAMSRLLTVTVVPSFASAPKWLTA